MQDRREFLKLAGGSLGGLLLGACKGAGGTRDRIAPNGYRFHRLINRGDPLPGGRMLTDLPGSAMISEVGTILFHAQDSTGALGCYELSVDYGGPLPKVVSTRKVVRDGDLLPDGMTVAKVTPGDLNRSGAYASVLKLEDRHGAGIYLDDGHDLRRVVGYRDDAPGVNGFIGQRMGDVDLHDDNDLLFVSHFGNQATNRPEVGLFCVPGGQVGAGSRLVASSGDLVPDADGILRSFGLVDRNDGGYYVVQATVELGRLSAAAWTAGRPEHARALLAGHLAAGAPAALLAASPTLRVSPAVRGRTPLVPPGEVICAPRIGTRQNIAFIVHTSDEAMTLFYEDRPIAATGGRSPRGAIIDSIAPAVLGDDGLLHFEVFTDVGTELCLATGRGTTSILATGDLLPYDHRNSVSRFLFGAMNKQVDSRGRIAFTCDFTNANQQISAVVVGIPV